ncbi:MAG: MOP flippase family protein [Rhodomicrobium sp.]
MSNWREKAALGGRWLGASTLIGAAVSLLQTALIARFFLAPSDYGLMGIVTVFTYIAFVFADMGLGAAIIHRRDATREQLSSVYWLNILSMLACILIACSLATPVANLMAEPQVAPLIRAMTLMVFFEALGKPFQMQLERDTRFQMVGLAELAGHACALATALISAALGAGVWSLVLGQISRSFTKALFYVPAGIRYYRPLLRLRRSDLSGFLSFGLFQMGERIVHVLASRFDFLLIGRFLGMEPLGVYNISVQLADVPVTQFAVTMVRTALPLMSSVQKNRDQLRQAYLKYSGIQMLVISPVLFGMMAVAPVAVPLALGQKWVIAVPIIQWLSMVSVIRAADIPRAALVLAAGRAGLSFYYNLVILIVIASVVAAAVYWGTIITVVMSLFGAYLCLNVIVYYIVVRPILGDCYFPYLSRISHPIIASALMAVALLSLEKSNIIGNELALLAAQIVIGAGIYIGLMHLWRLDQLRDLASMLPRRLTPRYLRPQIAYPA